MANAPARVPGRRGPQRRQPRLRPAGLRRHHALRGDARCAPPATHPTVQTFDFLFFRQLVDRRRSCARRRRRDTYVEGDDFLIMSYSGSGDMTAAVGRGRHQPRPRRAPARAAARRPTSPASRPAQIALMQRGTCTFGDEGRQRGGRGRERRDHLQPGQHDQRRPQRPVRRHARRAGRDPRDQRLATRTARSSPTAGSPTRASRPRPRTTSARPRNIIAETPGGDPTNVVVVGSHLDSVPEGPGINDNGTGSAFNLELALQMAKMQAPANKVRFAWWGAEEEGLLGSTDYVPGLSDAAFENIEMNLNFDMLGSPNHAMFVYDGDFSDTPPPATAPDVNPGAAEIEQDVQRLLRVAGPAAGAERRSTDARTTRRSRTTASRRAACSPAPRCPRRPRRRRSGAACPNVAVRPQLPRGGRHDRQRRLRRLREDGRRRRVRGRRLRHSHAATRAAAPPRRARREPAPRTTPGPERRDLRTRVDQRTQAERRPGDAV